MRAKPPSNKLATSPKRRGGRSAKAKGARGETEVVAALTTMGLPSQRVIGSGAHAGAVSDLKVAIRMNEDGSEPGRDESQGVLRAEVKNRQDNPDWPHQNLKDEGVALIVGSRDAPEILWTHLNQDSITKAVIMKRAKTPSGALKDQNYNESFGVFMGLTDFAALVKRAYPDRVFFAKEAA